MPCSEVFENFLSTDRLLGTARFFEQMPRRSRGKQLPARIPGGQLLLVDSEWRLGWLRLFAFAAHMIVPVHVRALRIFAPCPYVQLEKRIEIEPVGRADELKILPVERWRFALVVFQPRLCVHNVFDAD